MNIEYRIMLLGKCLFYVGGSCFMKRNTIIRRYINKFIVVFRCRHFPLVIKKINTCFNHRGTV